MLTPSSESLKIRRLVEKLTDEDLRSQGPKDLQSAIEKIGLSYAGVRENVNNELARARRLRGIRKGRGRRIAADLRMSQKDFEMFKRFQRMDELKKTFKSWAKVREVVEACEPFIEEFGSVGDFLEAIQIKQDAEL